MENNLEITTIKFASGLFGEPTGPYHRIVTDVVSALVGYKIGEIQACYEFKPESNCYILVKSDYTQIARNTSLTFRDLALISLYLNKLRTDYFVLMIPGTDKVYNTEEMASLAMQEKYGLSSRTFAEANIEMR